MSSHAGVWIRIAAFALDYIVILVYFAVIALMGRLINSVSDADSWLFADRVRAQLSGFLLVTLPVTLYFALSESSSQRATWGKKKMKLQVTDTQGGQIGVWRSLARTVLKFLPWEVSHTLVWTISFSSGVVPAWVTPGFFMVYAWIGLNIVCLIFTSKHQTIYDLLTKTCVTTIS